MHTQSEFQQAPVTFIILAATILVSWRAFSNTTLFEKLLNNPYRVKHEKQYYRLLSHALIHADFMHLALNMYVFYSFGSILEKVFRGRYGFQQGEVYFILLYAVGAVVATLPSLRKHGDNYGYNAVGASGAVSAVMMGFMILFPTMNIQFFFILPMPAFLGIIVFFGLEHYMNRRGKTNIAHDAHIWGALFGILFVFVTDPQALVSFFTQVRHYIQD
jgi:membrane associated rhomboid family serine protease